MSSDQMIPQILKSVLLTNANIEQIIQQLESIEKRLSHIEVKMSQTEKWLALENSDFPPSNDKLHVK
jgi:tetrahydromethanopterin S-methyltransferase subunit G